MSAVPALLPAVLAALAYVTATLPGAARLRLRRLTTRAVPASSTVTAVAAGLAGALWLGPGWFLVGAAFALAAPPLLRRRAARRTAAATTAALPDVCRATAAELRAGATPGAAIVLASEGAPPALAAHLRRLAAAARLGPPPAPDQWAALPGAEPLRSVAALWTVAADSGAGLAKGLDRVAEALAAEQRLRDEVAAQLAGPTASAAVLAALPLGGLGLAASLGAHPLAFLLHTPLGLVCALAGAALDALGVWWVRRITARASP